LRLIQEKDGVYDGYFHLYGNVLTKLRKYPS